MRPVPLACAIALLAALWILPLDRGGEFPAHMARHMGLVALAAPALVLGLPALFTRLTVPVLAGAMAEFAIVWGWHLPALHGAARNGAIWFAAEQALFLAGGLAVWAGAIHARHPLAGAGVLVLTSMHMTLLGALLLFAGRDLYAGVCGRAPDLGAQQLGGLLMLGIATPVYLVGGLVLAARSLGPAEAR